MAQNLLFTFVFYLFTMSNISQKLLFARCDILVKHI